MIPSWKEKGEETRNAYLWSYILNTPFWTIFNMLPFILCKDLNATLWQVTLLVTLKPVASLFSVYWSDAVSKRQDKLVSNVMWGSILGHLPFLFFPWMEHIGWFIASSVIYMLFYRGVIPAWMEILKLHVPASNRHYLVSYAITLSYVGGAIFPVFFGWMMDDHYQAWRWIFPLTAIFSMLSIFLQKKIPQRKMLETLEKPFVFLRPWKNMWNLLKVRRDFLYFQVGFMLGGFGLMLIQPGLPEFFMSVLDLNYKELGMAIAMCKGIGFALTSSLWASWMARVSMMKFSAVVILLFALFPIGLYMASYHIIWLYVAYLGYGVMQAGSELAWKLSGPFFSGDQDSSIFSGVNVLTVGIRGLIANPLGGLLMTFGGWQAVMIFSFFLCLMAGIYLMAVNKRAELTARST